MKRRKKQKERARMNNLKDYIKVSKKKKKTFKKVAVIIIAAFFISKLDIQNPDTPIVAIEAENEISENNVIQNTNSQDSVAQSNNQATTPEEQEAKTATSIISEEAATINIEENIDNSLVSNTTEDTLISNNNNEVLSTDNGNTQNTTSTSQMEVHFLDVGQGDSTIIICDGQVMVIDAGTEESGTAIQLYLTRLGISTIDILCLTHNHADHIGGADVLISKFQCNCVLLSNYESDTRAYDNLIQALNYRYIQPTYPLPGERYSLGSSTVTIIGPNIYNYPDENSYSICLTITHGDNTFLFTGDAEADAELDMIYANHNIDTDVYHCGHHGSSSSTSTEFLAAMTPEYCVISCGENNSYGHPHAQTLNSLRTANIQTFRTDEQGTIIAYSDGYNITWNTSPSETWISGEPTITVETEEEPAEEINTPDVNENITYVLNLNSLKFHYPDCNSVSNMAAHNRQDVTYTREEIINMGFTPCGNCNP